MQDAARPTAEPGRRAVSVFVGEREYRAIEVAPGQLVVEDGDDRLRYALAHGYAVVVDADGEG